MEYIRKFNVACSILGGYVLLLLSFLIVFEIIARKLFSYSLQGVDELGGYVVAITGTFGFAYALIERTHTRIDIILGHVPPLPRNLLNLLAYALVTGAALFMLRYGYVALSESILLRSSGYEEIDQALLKAVRRAAPYRPFPDHLTDPSISIQIFARAS